MNKCILPFTTNVEILAYQNKAFPLGVLKANLKDYDIWLCNKLINCVLKLNGEFNSYDDDLWSIKDGITTEQFMQWHPSTYANKGFDLVLFNKEMINEGSYISGQYNEFYIKGKRAYQKRNYDHDYMIFGYDDEAQVFKSAGYLANGEYSLFDITYEAYYNSVINNERDPLCINYYKINTDYLPEVNIGTIKEEMENYFYSRVDNLGTKTRADLGLKVWDRLVEYVEENEGQKLDFRYSRLCMEHRGIMSKRLKKLYQLGFFRNEVLVEGYYQNVFMATQVVYNLFLKYNLTKNAKTYRNIIELLIETNKSEAEYIRVALEEILV